MSLQIGLFEVFVYKSDLVNQVMIGLLSDNSVARPIKDLNAISWTTSRSLWCYYDRERVPTGGAV
jgi:hypothetical protein